MISQGLLRSIHAHAADRLSWYERLCEAGKVGPKFVAFHHSQHRFRMLRGPNQSGKTWAGAAEDWWQLTGKHPHRAVRRNRGVMWIVIRDYDNLYKSFCRKMWEIAPRHLIHRDCSYTPEKGFITAGSRMIKMHDGYIAEFRSGKGDVTAMASGTVDAIHIDEPPTEKHFSEATSRVSVEEGPVWVTFTPIGAPVKWLKEHVEGIPEKDIGPRQEWDQFNPWLTVEDCPHRSERSIRQQIEGYLPDEREQRSKGAWEGVTPDRYLDAWNDTLELSYPPGMPLWELLVSNGWRGEREDVRIGIAGDHGEQRAGANVWGLGCYDERTGEGWLLDEWASEGAVDEHQVAEQLRALLERSGLTFNAVDRARGDTNTPGFGHVRRLNTVLTQAVAELAGCPAHKPPFTIRDASKGPGSVRSGLRAINVGCTRRVFRVTSRCRRTLAALRHFKGPGVTATLHHKDPLDMVRYLFVSPGFLLDRYRPTGTPLMGH